jgi:hypothetical protein
MDNVRERLTGQMTRAQALRLRKLSHEAYQSRQFEENLTQTEALLRIEALEKEIELADSFLAGAGGRGSRQRKLRNFGPCPSDAIVTNPSHSKTKQGHAREGRKIRLLQGEPHAPRNRAAIGKSVHAGRGRGICAKQHAAQPDPVRTGWIAQPHRVSADRARDGRAA